ncbi:Inosine-uridine preferring nucleoside hydrolase [Anaerocolumna jejuensis DSM 15929]|uniref:Inosine-uridine preferring nucleoside hydrolase n=1 Tax=Anaerocolumna jejuensis DSM 15929 TaxID=1121322 RepID=A0A1M6QMP0_9FIRM|nr:nucleoside hydrolase [Anaerocolumna jejuensis]SHK21486.1 Inosine-uridine preferring nucleoside hydrolase [Anaerocolumna jejuensis DSM 15929]
MFQYAFEVPENKKYRVIIHTDCKNEADDQFALAHHLMTTKFNIRGIIAGHFELNPQEYGKGNTVDASYDEISKVLGLMGLESEYKLKVLRGSKGPIADEDTQSPSEGADFIIQEAMKESEQPLFAVFQGCLTDLASAILKEPEICSRMTAVWIGGGKWPVGGFEFNLMQDINAANVVFKSKMHLWQIPINVYKQIAVSLAELQYRVQPHGEIGNYLFTQMVEFNKKLAAYKNWPHGESWGLGDQGTVTVLLEELERMNYDWKPAPVFAQDMHYLHEQNNRPIRVYHTLDSRFTMEDFYAKLALNFPADVSS